MTRRRPPQAPVCEVLGSPHADAPLRPYVTGWCCPNHTPAAMAGRPEPPPGPGWPSMRDPAAPPWAPPAAAPPASPTGDEST